MRKTPGSTWKGGASKHTLSYDVALVEFEFEVELDNITKARGSSSSFAELLSVTEVTLQNTYDMSHCESVTR